MNSSNKKVVSFAIALVREYERCAGCFARGRETKFHVSNPFAQGDLIAAADGGIENTDKANNLAEFLMSLPVDLRDQVIDFAENGNKDD